jgi:signal transduction histidine kinase
VEDTGPGVPSDSRERIFERFYTADAARTRTADEWHAGGAGLGLPIARWIAEAHHGELRLADTGPSGSRFVLALIADRTPVEPDRTAFAFSAEANAAHG